MLIIIDQDEIQCNRAQQNLKKNYFFKFKIKMISLFILFSLIIFNVEATGK